MPIYRPETIKRAPPVRASGVVDAAIKAVQGTGATVRDNSREPQSQSHARPGCSSRRHDSVLITWLKTANRKRGTPIGSYMLEVGVWTAESANEPRSKLKTKANEIENFNDTYKVFLWLVNARCRNTRTSWSKIWMVWCAFLLELSWWNQPLLQLQLQVVFVYQLCTYALHQNPYLLHAT